MRTVHETEALRPSDPVPRNHSQAQVKPQRIKLVLKGKQRATQAETNADEEETLPQDDDITTIDPLAAFKDPLIYFDEEELSLPPKDLYTLHRHKLRWAEEEGERLRKENEELEKVHKKEWLKKELVLVNLIEAELANASQNPTVAESPRQWQKLVDMKDAMLPEVPLPMRGPLPWYRIPASAENAEDGGVGDGGDNDGVGGIGGIGDVGDAKREEMEL